VVGVDGRLDLQALNAEFGFEVLRRGPAIGRSLRRSVAIVATTGLLGACATAPTGPTVMTLPGSGKTLEQFLALNVADLSA
jgi:hypothetical protein